FAQILPISIAKAGGNRFNLHRTDVAHTKRDFFDASNLQALPRFDGFNECGGLDEGFRRARIEPGKTATEYLDAQLPAGEIFPVDVGYLEFTACGWLEILRDLNHLVVVEVQSRDGEMRLGSRRLFLERIRSALVI